MLTKEKKFKLSLGILIPIFVLLLVAGFSLIMIGYRVGSQGDDNTTN
jgi:hypothetical protein